MNLIEQIEKAFELKEEGYSLREIAKEIGVSKSTVDRWLKAENSPDVEGTDFETPTGHYNPFLEEPPFNEEIKKMEAVPHPENSQYILELRKIELQHERDMEILRQKDREISLQELQQSNYKREMNIKRLEAFEKEVEKITEMKNEEKRLEGEKYKLLKRFLKLFKVYKEHATGYSWSIKEVKEFVKRLEKLRDDVELFCDDNSIEYPKLTICYYLHLYIDRFNDLLIENENSFWGSNSLKFDLSEEELIELDEILETSSFDELAIDIEDDFEEVD